LIKLRHTLPKTKGKNKINKNASFSKNTLNAGHNRQERIRIFCVRKK
jgi:hypothetical protein